MDLVRAALGRILESPGFANAPRLQRFLTHVVEHRLRGDTTSLKEYALGLEVFDRDESFDPRIDTIVRVHARRLRARLGRYYADAGRDETLRIAIPKGQYGVEFHWSGASGPAGTAFDGAADPSDPRPRPGPIPERTVPIDLPAPRTPLVGRDREREELRELLLDDGARLLTLTGVGGSGKTRLALQLACDVAERFPDGVGFISLSAATDAEGVAAAIASSLGVRRTGGHSLEDALLAYLRKSVAGPRLLVLDNFEQVVDAAVLVGRLLDACAPLRILVTSRIPLHLYGEHEYPLGPLQLPDLRELPALDELAANPAMALFQQRARSALPAWRLDDSNAALVAELCCRLDGLPLAIELAAPHVRNLSPAQMLERFGGALALPETPARDVPERQRTIRRSIDGSHQLLDAGLQKLFRRISVFVGGFTLEAAEAVADAPGDLGSAAVAAGITTLAEHSLIVASTTDPDGHRYDMLETLREYARERLRSGGDEAISRRAHAAYYLVLAEEGLTDQPEDPGHEAWLRRCERERENFHAALDTLLATGEVEWAMRLGQPLVFFWLHREHFAEGARWMKRLLEGTGSEADPVARARVQIYHDALLGMQGAYPEIGHRQALAQAQAVDNPELAAAACNGLAASAHFHGRHAEAQAWWEACLEICRKLGNGAVIAAALCNLAQASLALGDHQRASTLLEQAREAFDAAGDEVSATWCLDHLGDAAMARGELDAAALLYRRAMQGFLELGYGWGVAQTLTDLGHLELRREAIDAARRHFQAALRVFLQLGHQRGVARLLEGCACVAAHEDDGERALCLAGAAGALRRRLESPPRPVEQARMQQVLGPAWERLAAATARRAWETGKELGFDRAIAYALAPGGSA